MINIKKIKPLFTQVLLTADTYDDDQTVDGLIDTSKTVGTLKDIQKVVAIGSAVCKEIEVDKYVAFKPDRFAVKKHNEGSLKDGIITDNPVMTYNFPLITLDGKNYLLVDNRDIEFVIEDFDEVPDKTDILVN